MENTAPQRRRYDESMQMNDWTDDDMRQIVSLLLDHLGLQPVRRPGLDNRREEIHLVDIVQKD